MASTQEDARAQQRSKLGLHQEFQQVRTEQPHPRRGGARGYPVYQRLDEIQADNEGRATVASISSLRRWRLDLTRKRMTGGVQREAMVGFDMFLLCRYLFARPCADADEIALYIFNNGGAVYSRSQISERMQHLEFTKKRSSTEAYQAFLPVNLMKCHFFWTMPPPLGVVGVERRRLVDFDECGIELEQTNKSYGHGHVSLRIRKPGHYTKSTKLTVIMAIEPGDPNLPPHSNGSVARPRRWIRVRERAGTTAFAFADFCEEVCTSIEVYPVAGLDNQRIFMWDNLQSHLSPLVHQIVEARNGNCHFSILRRPPYQPKYGPIEYAFCDLIQRLQFRVDRRTTLVDLRHIILQIASQLGMNGGFDNTFEHCGYTVDGQY